MGCLEQRTAGYGHYGLELEDQQEGYIVMIENDQKIIDY